MESSHQGPSGKERQHQPALAWKLSDSRVCSCGHSGCTSPCGTQGDRNSRFGSSRLVLGYSLVSSCLEWLSLSLQGYQENGSKDGKGPHGWGHLEEGEKERMCWVRSQRGFIALLAEGLRQKLQSEEVGIVLFCHPDWGAMAWSQVITTSAPWVQAILLPQPSEAGATNICHHAWLSFYFGKLRWADHFRLGVREQPGQHGETPSLLKVQKLAGCGSGHRSNTQGQDSLELYNGGELSVAGGHWQVGNDFEVDKEAGEGLRKLCLRSSCEFWGSSEQEENTQESVAGVFRDINKRKKVDQQFLRWAIGWALWLTSVIPALWEAEEGRSRCKEFETSLTNIVFENLSSVMMRLHYFLAALFAIFQLLPGPSISCSVLSKSSLRYEHVCPALGARLESEWHYINEVDLSHTESRSEEPERRTNNHKKTHFGRPRLVDHLRSGVRDPPGQPDETFSLLNIQKLSGHGGEH
ncbi:hypothetical protein AAY473_016358, partial [Plecturocebus cupreus]